MSRQELTKFFFRINWYLKKFVECVDFPEHKILIEILKPLKCVKKSSRSWDTAIQWYLEGSCARFFIVPFQAVLHLVAKRSVTLKHGKAFVPFCKLHELLGNIFTWILKTGLGTAAEQRVKVLQDERIQILFKKVLVMSTNFIFKWIILHFIYAFISEKWTYLCWIT